MYTFKYRLNKAPQPRDDGSGMVSHPITAIASTDDGETWEVVPAHSKTVEVPGDDLQIVLDMPDSTGQERQAKNATYKNLLKANVNTQVVPGPANWTVLGMTEFMLTNDAAESVAAEANDYITITLNQTYPVEFSL